jgi:gamma-glutamyltranspeptidase/glutathione hydrolase
MGPKQAISAEKAVCASQHPIVTDTMLQVMRDGGNAVDAAIAGCLVQAVVQQEMTNHTGTVTFLYYEAATGKTYQLDSGGLLVSDLAPFRPIPPGTGVYASGYGAPCACIPGFMPGLKAMHERFGTKPWADLCQSAIYWAAEGHPVNSFELMVLATSYDFFLYSESGRKHFLPNGFVPEVGQRVPKPELAAVLRHLAEEGPDYFITGGWAEHFVERANQMGWEITLDHMDAIPPRWGDPLRYAHRGYEIVQMAPPQRTGVYSALVLGILEHLDVASLGHYTESPESLYYLAHALRRAEFETGMLHDPEIFDVPTDLWLSSDFQRQQAELLRRSKPTVDLTRHVELVAPPHSLAAAGLQKDQKPPTSSCELSLVDADGNWVQMMNTLQSGGIPGEVVDGVPMVGSHSQMHMRAYIAGWFTGGGRMRTVLGHTFVLRDGKPWISLGTPGNVYCTMPQVLANLLDFGMDPYEAIDAPRMLPLDDDYTLTVESRLPSETVAGMAQLGIRVTPHPAYDWHMGSFQMSWRDDDGTLHSTVDPRRAGKAAGF